MATRKKTTTVTAETEVETAVVKTEETPKAAPIPARKEYRASDLIPCT